ARGTSSPQNRGGAAELHAVARPRMTSGSLTRIAVSITDQAGEAVMELLGELSGQPASVFTNAKTRKTVASVFLGRASDWSGAKQGVLRARLLHLRHCGIDIGAGR